MNRVVLDLNVLVSARISPAGAPAALLSAWVDGAFELVVSDRLLDDLEAVLSRPKFRRYFDEREAADYVSVLRQWAVVAPEPDDVPNVTPDPEDDRLVALATSAGARVLVSGDAHLHGLAGPGPVVKSPGELLLILSSP